MAGWPYPLTVVTLFVIVLLRAGGTYAIGRAAQAGAHRTRLAAWLRRPGYVKAQALLERWGAPVVSLSFLTVGLQTLVNLAAGLARMPLVRYVPALLVGSVLWAFLYATVGFATFTAWWRLYQVTPGWAVTAAVMLLAGIAAYVVWQVRARRSTSVGA